MSEPTGASSKIVYNGSFDLSFLRVDESVQSAGFNDGSCWVTRHLDDGTEAGIRVRLGETLERLPDGILTTYGPEPAVRCCSGCPDCLGIGVKQQLVAAARLERVLDALGRYDETCEDRCECCATWRGTIVDAIREADGGSCAKGDLPASGGAE